MQSGYSEGQQLDLYAEFFPSADHAWWKEIFRIRLLIDGNPGAGWREACALALKLKQLNDATPEALTGGELRAAYRLVGVAREAYTHPSEESLINCPALAAQRVSERSRGNKPS